MYFFNRFKKIDRSCLGTYSIRALKTLTFSFLRDRRDHTVTLIESITVLSSVLLNGRIGCRFVFVDSNISLRWRLSKNARYYIGDVVNNGVYHSIHICDYQSTVINWIVTANGQRFFLIFYFISNTIGSYVFGYWILNLGYWILDLKSNMIIIAFSTNIKHHQKKEIIPQKKSKKMGKKMKNVVVYHAYYFRLAN